MVRKPCVYRNLAAVMLMQGVDIISLSLMTFIDYKSMCKKLNGDARITVEEAILIYKVLGRVMPVDKLFERSEECG